MVTQSDSDCIGCRIVVDGAAKAETIPYEVSAVICCLLSAA
jgi:hypothetical protein